MKTFLLTLCVALTTWAQSITLSVTPTGVLPGGTATVTLTYTDPTPSANLAGLQWQLSLPSQISLGVPPLITAIDVGLAAGKIAQSNPVNGYTILAGTGCFTCTPAIALNNNTIPTGGIASATITVASTATAGPLNIGLASCPSTPTTCLPLLGSDPNGNPITLTGGNAAITLNVLSKYDINGDGIVNAADILTALPIALRVGICSPPFSLVGNGKCDVSDLILVIQAVLGKIPL